VLTLPEGSGGRNHKKTTEKWAHRPAVSTWLSGYPQQESRDIARFKPSPDPRIGYPPVFIPDTGKSLRIHLKVELFFHQELEFLLDRAEIRPL